MGISVPFPVVVMKTPPKKQLEGDSQGKDAVLHGREVKEAGI